MIQSVYNPAAIGLTTDRVLYWNGTNFASLANYSVSGGNIRVGGSNLASEAYADAVGVGVAEAVALTLAEYLAKADNLSGLASVSTARTNLGLGTLATQNGTFSGTSSGTNTGDQDLSGLLVKSANLSDLTNTGTARTNLGLGTFATISSLAHSATTGLTSGDDHTQYALLAGRSGGQTLNGDTASGGNLTLRSTAHATKGKILFGTSTYDEVNNRLTFGAINPGAVTPSGLIWINRGGIGLGSPVIRIVEGSGGEDRLLIDGEGNITCSGITTNGNTTFGNLAFNGGDVNYTPGNLPIARWSSGGQFIIRSRLEIGTTDEGNAAAVPLIVQGKASQSAVILQIKGVSSTTAGREQVDLDTAWATSTDASRKARFLLRVWDTAARECIRAEASGSAAMLGLYGVTAVIQPAGAAQAAITNSTGGTADGTLVDVTTTAVADPAKINDNFTEVYTLLNAMRTAMVNLGSMKGAA